MIGLRFLVVIVLVAVALSRPAAAHNGAVAVAVPLRGITVDGDLSDWPANLRSYPIALTEYGVSPKGPEDYQGSFRVGFDPEAAVLLVAIETHDDSHVIDRTPSRSWYTEDGCELYLDPAHGERSVAAQHSLRGVQAPGQAQAATGPSARVGWSAANGVVRYEWAVQLEGLSADSLRIPRTVGLDVVLCDRDEDGSFSWMAWGPGAGKPGRADLRGDVVLIPDAGSPGLLHGEALWADSSTAMTDRAVRVQSTEYPQLWVRERTDGQGIFDLELPEGRYRADLELGRRKLQAPISQVYRGKTTRISLTARPGVGQTVKAGPGVTVKAGGYRQGSWQLLGAQDGLLSGRVTSLHQDHQGYLWLGTSAGLCRYDGLSFLNLTVADSLTDPWITALAEDRSGNLWIGTRAGVSRYDGRTFTHFGVEDGLIDPSVTALLVDRSGALWVGTAGGLCRLDGQDIACYSTAQGLVRNQVTALTEDTDGGLWVACGGLCRFDGQAGFLPAARSPPTRWRC
ncbi:MAG: two-component regulator propeller domain-containing protein [Candidatus Latescibacterota bacterium]